MKQDKLSTTLTKEDFPDLHPAQLWINLDGIVIAVNASEHGINLTTWIDTNINPHCKVTKKTYKR